MMNNAQKYALPVALMALVTLATLAAMLLRGPYRFHGGVIDPPLPVNDFALQTAGGKSFRLSEQEETLVLLFFGYTNCPDVCPTTLATFKEVSQRLGKQSQRVRFVMITADPERDTPERIAAYTARFHPDFIGLSGSTAQLSTIWKELGIFVEKQPSASALGYLVSHTSSVFVIDGNANLIMTFPYGSTATEMSEDLQQLLRQESLNDEP